MNYYFLKSKERSQTLVLIIFIVVIFSATIAAIAGLTTRELEMEEIGERALQVSYVSESGSERARYVLKGSALKFDGDDYVSCGDDESLDITNTITIEAWVKVSNDPEGGYDDVVNKEEYSSSTDTYTGYWLRVLTNRRVGFWLGNKINGTGNVGAIYVADAITYNNWHLLTGTYDGEYLRIFVDGELIGESPYNGGIGTNNKILTIGGLRANPNFNGSIDEVRIYNRPLNESEVLEHYQGKYFNESGLVLLQHFEEGPNCQSGNCLSDDSGNDNNATPTFPDSDLSEYDVGDSGWTRDYPLSRGIYIGGLSGNSENPPSCPDSKLPCQDKNVFLIGGINYYYNAYITPNGAQRPNNLGSCSKVYCIDTDVKASN